MEIKESDFELLDNFSLKWRWTDERWSTLPDETLQKIRPFNAEKSRELHDVCIPYFSKYGLVQEYFGTIERIETSAGGQKVMRWLTRSLGNSDKALAVSWDENTAVLVDAQTFVKFWADFCYPSSDDVASFPFDLQWMLGYFHDEYFEFGRTKF